MKEENSAAKETNTCDSFFIRAKRWLDNYFYHYKWHTVIGAFLLFVLIWCVASACSQVGTDVFLGYVGSYTYSPDEKDKIAASLSDAFDLDLNGDGETMVDFNAISYLSLSEAEERFEEAELFREEYQLSAKGNAQNYQIFRKQFESGDISVWLLSADVYADIDREMLVPLSDILEVIPDAATDGYAVDVSRLPFKKAFLPKTPDKTVMVLRKKYFTGLRTDEEEQKEYELNCDFFRRLISYR